jgi:hypothetical protein
LKWNIVNESTDLDARLRSLGSDAAQTAGCAPRARDELRLRLRFIAELIREAGEIHEDAVLLTRAAGKLMVTTLAKTITFGRNTACDVNVPADAELSRNHFRLVPEKDAFFVEDLDSRNGTFVNNYDARIKRRELRNGDLILAGSQVLLFWRKERDAF